MNKPRILFYDIETSPLKAWLWQCGKQYISHKQLVPGFDQWGIICVAYCWNDDLPAQSIDWGYNKQNTAKVVKQFDKIIRQADHVIGKNSDKFDSKMINASRMLHGIKGMPEWMLSKDDLEKQMRKYFRLPSQSLDYLSKQLGLGGKIRMEMQDWVDIVDRTKNGPIAFQKMIDYNKKDVEDTRTLWYKLSEHFDPRFNMSTFTEVKCCKHEDCGSVNIAKNGTRVLNRTKYQLYRCSDCGRAAGRTIYNSVGRIT